MERRNFIRNSSMFFAALALMKDKAFAGLSDSFNIRMLTKEIGIFSEKGGTILFYLSKDGYVVIDAQFPETAVHLVDELKKKSDTFRLLINTHHHFDHTSGNIVFKDLVPHVLAHENSKTNQQKKAEEDRNTDKQLFPNQTYTDTWCEKFGKEEICLHYFGPAHTSGDSIVHFKKANIVHLGDLVFNRKHPFIDKSAGGDIANWIKLLDHCTSTFSRKTTYVCGHSITGYDVVVKAEDLTAFRDYLRNLLLYTSAQISAGKTKDQILKATEIPGSPQWTGDIVRPLSAAYNELTSKFE